MREDSRTELKRDVSDSISKAAVAFSNTEGGSIYIGIDDDGSTIGLSDPDSSSIRCVQLLKDTVRPDIMMTSNIRDIDIDGKQIICVDISEGNDKPYYLREKGLRAEGVYVRKGTANVPVSEEMFKAMLRDFRSRRFEQMISFEQDLTFDFTASVFRKKGIVFDEEKMRALHIIEGSKYTNLGLMMSDQFDSPVKAALFPDEYKSSFLDRDEFRGSILEQFDSVMRFISGHNTLDSKIIGVDRIDRYAYPIEAIREAVLNALTHRDYSMNGTILISMFPDNMTISSPGGLDGSYTIDDLRLGVSALRNPNLSNILYRLGYIESYGTGIPRLMKSYEGKKEPVLLSTNSVFYVRLPSMLGTVVTKENREKEIFITRSDLERIGMTRNEAIKRIDSMLSEGKMVKCGGGRSTRYRVSVGQLIDEGWFDVEKNELNRIN